MSRLLAFVLGFVLTFAYVSTSQAATISCSWTCYGTDNPDQITGSGRYDDIYAKGGGDTIYERAAPYFCDYPVLGVCTAGGWSSRIYGGGGPDAIVDTATADCPPDHVCYGDADSVYGGNGGDTIYVNDGDSNSDSVECGDGEDTVYADPVDSVASDCEHVVA